ncbi:polysaccharide biosynthesis C-terminal domain-containing protein [Haloferax sp. S1W]|uniref:oligosaccharide flippase family protein n=1 Tax=Haloferax sp. S1W TaxID=3377110 RepID=UPI0037C838B6
MNIGKSIIKLFSQKVATSILNFLALAFFARQLGASEMGTYFLFHALIRGLHVPADAGISEAVQKRLSESNDQGEFLAVGLVLKIVVLLFILPILLLFQTQINAYLGADLSLYLILGVILHETAEVLEKVLAGELRVGETAMPQIIRQLSWVASGVVFVVFDFGVEGIVIAFLVGLGMMVLLLANKVSISIDIPDIDHFKSILDYARYSSIGMAGSYFYNWMDVLILGLFVSQSLVGAYEIAWRVATVVILFSHSVSTTMFPQVSFWNENKSKNKIETLISDSLFVSLVLVIPALVGTIILSEDILSVVFGNEYAVAWLVLIILMAEKVPNAIHSITGQVLNAINQPKLAAKSTVLTLFLNIFLNILLIPTIGIVGAALATLISFSVNTFLHTLYLNRFVRIQPPLEGLFLATAGSLFMGIIVLFSKRVLGISSIIDLIVLVLIGAVSYACLLYGFSPTRYKISTIIDNMVNDGY